MEANIMLEVKIPSPPIARIKAHISSNNLDTAKVIRGYMDILTNSVQFIGKRAFSYTAGRVSDDGIFATIDIQQLPLYDKVAALFSNINFEQAMIAQIAVGNNHYGHECPIANQNNLRQPISTWSGRWITIYLWTILRADFSMRFLASPKQFVGNNLLMDALIERLGNTQNEPTTDTAIASPDTTQVVTKEAEAQLEKAVPANQNQVLLSEKNSSEDQVTKPEEPEDMLAVFEAQAQKEAEQKTETSTATTLTPTKKIEEEERVTNKNFDIVTANKTAADCIDMEALCKLIRQSNNEAIELHCNAQSMDITQVVAARQVISKETATEITAMIGQLLTTINNNPDFFEDVTRFKIEPKPIPKPIPIKEDDPI